MRGLPIADGLPRYHRDWLRADLVGGATVWAVLIPSALAYAAIVGVDPVVGLYTVPPALLAYAGHAASSADRAEPSQLRVVENQFGVSHVESKPYVKSCSWICSGMLTCYTMPAKRATTPRWMKLPPNIKGVRTSRSNLLALTRSVLISLLVGIVVHWSVRLD